MNKSQLNTYLRTQILLVRRRNKLTITEMADALRWERSYYAGRESGRRQITCFDVHTVERVFKCQIWPHDLNPDVVAKGE